MGDIIEHFNSPMINQGMQNTISVFNLGGVVQHFSSPTGNPISNFGNPISAFADGGNIDDISEKQNDLAQIHSLINEYRKCLIQKAICCSSDRMMQSHVYKEKALECKLKASKLINDYQSKYGEMEDSPFRMIDIEKMGEFADGGEMTIRYTIYDEVGDLVEIGLSSQELIELANEIYYYDMLDADESPMTTIEEAIDGFEAMDYRVEENEYYFAKGGKIKKPKNYAINPFAYGSEYYWDRRENLERFLSNVSDKIYWQWLTEEINDEEAVSEAENEGYIFNPKQEYAKGGKTKERVYIDFLNHKKNYQRDRKYFDSYEEAREWALKTMDKFNSDMIKYEFADGGMSDLQLRLKFD